MYYPSIALQIPLPPKNLEFFNHVAGNQCSLGFPSAPGHFGFMVHCVSIFSAHEQHFDMALEPSPAKQERQAVEREQGCRIGGSESTMRQRQRLTKGADQPAKLAANFGLFLSLGRYCPRNTKYATQFPCPRGTYSGALNLKTVSECQPCPPGKVCSKPGLMSPDGTCKPGWYCPPQSTSGTPVVLGGHTGMEKSSYWYL